MEDFWKPPDLETNTFLNNPWAKEETRREAEKYFELNQNENCKSHRKCVDLAKSLLRGSIHSETGKQAEGIDKTVENIRNLFSFWIKLPTYQKTLNGRKYLISMVSHHIN